MVNNHSMMECTEEEEAEAVSPMGQYFNSSELCIYIIGVLEFEIPLHDSQAMPLLRNVFLPINPRFSCIMVLILVSSIYVLLLYGNIKISLLINFVSYDQVIFRLML